MSNIWRIGTLLKRKIVADNVLSLTFSLPEWEPFNAGQHFDIRLTATDGYQAERSYSIASAPEEKDIIEFGIQLLDDGEVSPYLWSIKEGQQVEMRGPIGGHFIWDTSLEGPVILIGGGSGMVPMMSMLRHHMNNLEKDSGRKFVFIISTRKLGFVLYQQELEEIAKKDPNVHVVITVTDNPPSDWKGYARRIDKEMLTEVIGDLKNNHPMTFICGPTKFVEACAQNMINIGFDARTIKTERFGG